MTWAREKKVVGAVSRWLSLGIVSVLIGAWIVSHWCYIGWVTRSHLGAALEAGWVMLSRGETGNVYADTPGLHFASCEFLRMSFRFAPTRTTVRGLSMVSLPIWYAVVPACVGCALLWVPTVRGALQRRRGRRGLCPSCGYDRRGLAADAPCPECGSVPSPK